MSDKSTNGQNGNGQSNGHGLVRTDVPATVSFARNPLAKDALYRDLIEVLWRRKWVIIGIVAVCAAYAYYAIGKMTPIYTSSTRVYVTQNTPKILTNVESLQNGSSASSFMNVQVDRIKSTQIAKEAWERLTNRKTAEAPPPLWSAQGWKALEMDPKAVQAMYHPKLKTFDGVGNPVGLLKGLLTVDIGKNDDTLEITCETPYPDESALIVNMVVEAYKADDVTARKTSTDEVVAKLQKEKEVRDAELGDLQKRLEEIQVQMSKTAEMLIVPGQPNNAADQRLQALSAQWTEAQMTTAKAQARWVRAQSLMNDPDTLEKMVQAPGGPTIPPPSELAQARVALNDLNQELTSAERLGHEHPYYKRVKLLRDSAQTHVTELERKAAAMYYGIIEQEYMAAEGAEQDMKKLYDEQASHVAAMNQSSVAYASILNQLQRAEKLDDILDTRIKEIGVTQNVSAPTISILEEAQAPFFPSKPQKTKLMGIALAVGLFLGVGSAFLMDWMDHRIRTPEDIRSIVQLPILGLVPHVSRRVAFATLGQAVHLQPRSAVAESFRTVRMAVHFSGIERSCQKILVTSAVLGDGKTVTASNLAIAVAQAGQRAVIVDADFHRPRQHLIFGTPNEAGLSSVLQGLCPLEDVVLTTPIPRVDILPCGPLPANPYELLNSKAFNEIFDVLKLHYDHIIIDSPPVLAVADAMVLAAMCDATVLVARVHRSRRQAFEEAVACLGQVGTRVLGVVVNDVRGGKERYSLYRTNYYTKGSRMDALDPTKLLGTKN